ncbi:MAG: phage protease, partial [Pseudomonadota bacterium]
MFTALKSTGNPGAAEIGVSACFALGDVTADSAPKGKRGSVQLMPAGEFSARDGRGPFMSGDLASMQAIIERTLAYHQATDIVIDYEHQTMLAEDNGLPAPAAGWIKALKATDAGIMAEVEWTERAAAAIRADEYRHISPVFTHAKDDAGEVGLILNAALTNAPALDMAVVAARAATLLSPSQTETFLMKKELLEALGLDA